MYAKKLHFLAICLMLCVSVAFQGCSNPQKMINKGQYDAVVIKISDKFKKSLKRKPQDCGYLENAFGRANNADMTRINQLKAENNDANWTTINDLYKKVNARQERIAPLLPLKDDLGQTYNFTIVDVNQGKVESQQKAAEFHYNRGVEFMTEAQKMTPNQYYLRAREAYAEFDAVRKVNANYKDNAVLMRQAQELGTINILATYSDNSNSGQNYNKKNMQDSIFGGYKADTWTKIDFASRPNINYQFDLIFIINKIVVSEISTKDNSLPRTVNVDTTINNVRSTQTVNATVIQRQQRQSLRIEGTWQVIDKLSNTVYCNQSIVKTYIHTHTSATFTGDRRALTKEDDEAVKTPATFPSRESLIFKLAAQVREEIRAQCTWQIPR
jgi:hypothetical protein